MSDLQLNDSSSIAMDTKSSQVLACKFCPFTQIIGQGQVFADKENIEDNSFYPFQDFRHHIRETHFLCEICEIKYEDKYDLIEHLESHYSADRNCACNYERCTLKNKNVGLLFCHAQYRHHGNVKKPFTYLNGLVKHRKGNNMCKIQKYF